MYLPCSVVSCLLFEFSKANFVSLNGLYFLQVLWAGYDSRLSKAVPFIVFKASVCRELRGTVSIGNNNSYTIMQKARQDTSIVDLTILYIRMYL